MLIQYIYKINGVLPIFQPRKLEKYIYPTAKTGSHDNVQLFRASAYAWTPVGLLFCSFKSLASELHKTKTSGVYMLWLQDGKIVCYNL